MLYNSEVSAVLSNLFKRQPNCSEPEPGLHDRALGSNLPGCFHLVLLRMDWHTCLFEK